MTDVKRPQLALPDNRKKVLMHSCCAPCSGEVMEAMTASGIDYSLYFYTPNIHPDREYEIRKNENIRFAEQHRSEERRVGTECVSTCRSRGSQYHYIQTKTRRNEHEMVSPTMNACKKKP